jgi:phosphoribosyl-AMP cyclohydrolase
LASRAIGLERSNSLEIHMPDASPSPFAAQANVEDIENGTEFAPKFDAAGLVAAIATDADTGEVLMFAWMNAEALARTIETSMAHFWSRSRGRLWLKGEESGNILDVVDMRTDCDQDAIWMRCRIRQAPGRTPAACHTGRKSCFYRAVALGVPAPGARLTMVGPPTSSR